MLVDSKTKRGYINNDSKTNTEERYKSFLTEFLRLFRYINNIGEKIEVKRSIKLERKTDLAVSKDRSIEITNLLVPKWAKCADDIPLFTLLDPILAKSNYLDVFPMREFFQMGREWYFSFPLLFDHRILLLTKIGLSLGNDPGEFSESWYHRNNLVFFGFYHFLWSGVHYGVDINQRILNVLIVLLIVLFEGVKYPGENSKDLIESFFKSLSYFLESTKDSTFVDDKTRESLKNISTTYSILQKSDSSLSGTVEDVYFERNDIRDLPDERNLTSEILMTLCHQNKTLKHSNGIKDLDVAKTFEKKHNSFKKYMSNEIHEEARDRTHSKPNAVLLKFANKKKTDKYMGNSSFHESLRTGGDTEMPVLISNSNFDNENDGGVFRSVEHDNIETKEVHVTGKNPELDFSKIFLEEDLENNIFSHISLLSPERTGKKEMEAIVRVNDENREESVEQIEIDENREESVDQDENREESVDQDENREESVDQLGIDENQQETREKVYIEDFSSEDASSTPENDDVVNIPSEVSVNTVKVPISTDHSSEDDIIQDMKRASKAKQLDFPKKIKPNESPRHSEEEEEYDSSEGEDFESSEGEEEISQVSSEEKIEEVELENIEPESTVKGLLHQTIEDVIKPEDQLDDVNEKNEVYQLAAQVPGWKKISEKLGCMPNRITSYICKEDNYGKYCHVYFKREDGTHSEFVFYYNRNYINN